MLTAVVMSTTSSGTDLTAKYQKLAGEYAKLRAQLPVLKKGLIDEQKKSKDLTEDILERDLQLRKLEQEVDSLSFRNQQLSKRVEFLQDKLDEIRNGLKHPHKGIKKKPPHISSENGNDEARLTATVLQEELQGKLAENESLHKQIFELQLEHSNQLKSVEERVLEFDKKNLQLANELSAFKKQYDDTISALKEEKQKLTNELECAKVELAEISVTHNQERRLTIGTPDLADESELSRLDVVPVSSESLQDVISFHQSLEEVCGQCITNFANFHSYCDQRAQLYPCDASMEKITGSCHELSVILKDHVTIIRPIRISIEALCAKGISDNQNMLSCDIESVISAVLAYVDYSVLLFPAICKTMEEECSVSWCNSRLKQDNRAFMESTSKFQSCLSDLRSSLQEWLDLTNSNLSRSSLEALLTKIYSNVAQLASVANDVENAYSCKVTSEHQLPTATKRLKTTNECIIVSLHNFTTSLQKLSKLLEEKEEFIFAHLDQVSHRLPCLLQFKQEAANYMHSLTILHKKESSGKAIEMEENQLTSFGGETDAFLDSQIEDKNKRIAELEREKDHWMVEVELLRAKLNTASAYGAKTGLSDLATVTQQSLDLANNNNDGEKLEAIQEIPNGHMIEEYYGRRVEALVGDLHHADSKAIYYQQECANSISSLKLCQKHREHLEKELCNSNAKISSLTEDLESTRNSYESQLSTMSDHLADLNQRIAYQTDEIEALKKSKTPTGKRGLFKS